MGRRPRDNIPPTYTITGRGRVGFELHDPYHLALRISWPRFALLFLATNLVLNLIFAGLYFAVPGSVANTSGTFIDVFFFSFETMATVGYGAMSPGSFYGHVIATLEIMVGIGFTAIMTGLTFVRFARPTARVVYAERAIITRHEGQPTLMIRLGNGRTGLLADASVRLTALIARRSEEGHSFRLSHDLALRSARLPVFALSWTIMHTLDASSPLHGLTAESAMAQGLVLFLNFQARDPAIAAEVHDLHQYSAGDLTFAHRYVDIVGSDARGRLVADLTRISHTEAE